MVEEEEGCVVLACLQVRWWLDGLNLRLESFHNDLLKYAEIGGDLGIPPIP